jgi:tetratricopeptide (TPR) repeat protein
LAALERVLLGHGDEHDAMTSKTSLLDYIRGHRFGDPRIEVLLTRLRLDTSWTFDRRLEARLGDTVQRALPPDLLGSAWADFASLAALRGDAGAARTRFVRAVDLSWEPAPRARALLGRGWAHLAQGQARLAVADFREASGLPAPRRLLAASLWSLALALERSGQMVEARTALQRAGELDALRASASGRDVFDGVARLPAYEVHAVEALQAAFRLHRAEIAGNEESALLAHRQRCESLRRYLIHAEPDRSPWATHTRARWLACQEEEKAAPRGGQER